MTSDGQYTAVLDRFETTEERDVAVLLLERDGDLVDDLAVARDDLPEEARHQDAVLAVRVKNDEIVEADYQQAETTARKERAQQQFDRLSDRPSERNQ